MHDGRGVGVLRAMDFLVSCQPGALWGCLSLQAAAVHSNSLLPENLLSAAATQTELLESFVSSLSIDLSFVCFLRNAKLGSTIFGS